MLPHLHQGYVSNYTLSTSICHQPDLQSLHGFFVEPISIKTHNKLFPFFGSSKLTVNSEILFPAAMYYKGDPRFTTIAPTRPWSKKTNTLSWRGLASGGRNKEDNWRAFHRHRLVSMLNGTQALQYPSNSSFIDIQNLPLDLWDLSSWDATTKPLNEVMGEWLNSFTDVGFTNLNCFPAVKNNEGCTYTNYLFSPHKPIDLASQHVHKYLVDVDGNSFSGRYRDFLLSGSLPIKATLFQEWHDSRLVAWKHFVPLDNRFLDLYGIMEFFLGYGGGKGRDGMARRIAREGKEWAGRVLRVQDMRVYTYRLLLEYARVMDAERDRLGFVGDFVDNKPKGGV
jgi:Glycosyl transferase family 90